MRWWIEDPAERELCTCPRCYGEGATENDKECETYCTMCDGTGKILADSAEALDAYGPDPDDYYEQTQLERD